MPKNLFDKITDKAVEKIPDRYAGTYQSLNDKVEANLERKTEDLRGWLADKPAPVRWAGRLVLGTVGVVLALILAGLIAVGLGLALVSPNLPDVSELANYRPKLPLRIYSAEGALIGEFGEERRNLTPIKEIPKVMKDAVLAIEDARFYAHSGIDYIGMLRAGVANLTDFKSQGASTITMQVARNVYLTSERSFSRKIYELLLTQKLESTLSKDQILEIYMNQIFLGNRSHGFAAAAESYFGKSLKDLSIAEAAMLAGLPKAPSAYNPIRNPKRAKIRQQYIIERMAFHGYITPDQAKVAKAEELTIKPSGLAESRHADYVAEMVRQMIFAQYGEETYTRGFHVHTTLKVAEQEVAWRALRKTILNFDRRQAYRGPEKYIDLPDDEDERQELIDKTLAERVSDDELQAAVVLDVSLKGGIRRILLALADGVELELAGDALRAVQGGLSDKAAANVQIKRGAVVRVVNTGKDKAGNDAWQMVQLPEVEGAFVALDPANGSVRALVGGFDFSKNKFNHVTQAIRQPGSTFKPFVYSAALEKGFTGATVINDAPIVMQGVETGGQLWEPKNYDDTFDGPMSLRRGLAKSKNMISIRILRSVGTDFTQQHVTNFGFSPDKVPPYLTMALGAGQATPMQMAQGFAVFANGGYRVAPQLVTEIKDHKGRVLVSSPVPKFTEEQIKERRAIEPRNAFVMSSLMQEVTRSGTAARASAILKRSDIYGKTGTTNDSQDAWFVGYHPSVVAAVWIGYDTPKKLGEKETGGGLALPVWINYMEHALKGVPVATLKAPEGVSQVGGEWFYNEFINGGVRTLGLEDPMPPKPDAASSELDVLNPGNSGATGSKPDEKKGILEMFKN